MSTKRQKKAVSNPFRGSLPLHPTDARCPRGGSWLDSFKPLSRITATSSCSPTRWVVSNEKVSNPFRGSLPLHRSATPTHRFTAEESFKPLSRITATSSFTGQAAPPVGGKFQTPFEDHCHFITRKRTRPTRLGTKFQTPFEDHCHFIQEASCPRDAVTQSFKPLSRITATSSGQVLNFNVRDETFQTPFEDHCHFISRRLRIRRSDSASFKPLSRITATSSFQSGD